MNKLIVSYPRLAGTLALQIALAAHAQNPVAVAFSNDLSCGISPAKKYTHLVEFGNSGGAYVNPVVNGVRFLSTLADNGSMPDNPQYGWDNKYGWAGAPNGYVYNHAGGGYIVTPATEDVYKILHDFTYGVFNGNLLITGLTPGKAYEFRLYLRRWDLGARDLILTFRPDAGTSHAFPINPCAANNDQYVAYRYTADQSGVLTMSYDLAGENTANSLHFYALSNETVLNLLEPAGITASAATLGARVFMDPPPNLVTIHAAPSGLDGNPALWSSIPGYTSATAYPDNNGGWTNTLSGLAKGADYAYCFEADGLFSYNGAFTTLGDGPTAVMLPSAGSLVHALLNIDITYAGASGLAGILLYSGVKNHGGNLAAWQADGAATVAVFTGLGEGAHTFTAQYPSVSSVVHFRAFAFDAVGTNATPEGVYFEPPLLHIGLPKQWVWTGTVSHDWNNTTNWLDYATSKPPKLITDLNGGNLLLHRFGLHPPYNQNIGGLAVNELQVAWLTNHLEVTGQKITISRFNIADSVGGIFNAVFRNDIEVEASGDYWMIPYSVALHLHGTLSETGGSKLLTAAWWAGSLHLHGPVTLSGGIHNYSCHYYATNAVGMANPPNPTFYTGGHYFHLPPGMSACEYDLPAGNGLNPNSNYLPLEGVTVVVNDPVANNGPGRFENGFTGGILELTAATHTFTSEIFLNNGLFIFHGQVPPGDNAGIYYGSIDLNGHNLLDRTLNGYIGPGYQNDGAYRNQNPDTPVLINGNFLDLGASNNHVIQFGGVGDITYTGDILDGSANKCFQKVGSGTLTLSGAMHNPTATSGVLGGGLILDAKNNTDPKLPESGNLLLTGNLTLRGNPSAPFVQTVGDIITIDNYQNRNQNRSRITVGGANPSAPPVTFRFGNLHLYNTAWETSSNLDFAPGANGHIRTLGANHARFPVISPRVTWQGKTFATVNNDPDTDGYRSIGPVDDSFFKTDLDTAGTLDFVDIAGPATNTNYRTIPALRFNAPATLTLSQPLKFYGEDMGDYPLGAILVTPDAGNAPVVINGPGTLGHDSGNGGITIHQYNTNASLVINARVFSGWGTGLVKTGPGELVLTHPGNHFNRLYIFEGVVTFSETGSRFAPSQIGGDPGYDHPETLTICDGTLRYLGTNALGHATDRPFRVRGKAVVEASGVGPLAFTNASVLVNSNLGNHLLTLSGETKGVIAGSLDGLAGGRLRKTGRGTWELTATSHSPSIIWGCDILEGILVLNGTLGRDVTVCQNGTLAGKGKVQRNLTVKNGGVISISLNPQIPTSLNPPLTIGKHLVIESGAILALPRKGLPKNWTPVIEVGGKITGEFEKPANAYIDYNTQFPGFVSIKERPVGTLLLVR